MSSLAEQNTLTFEFLTPNQALCVYAALKRLAVFLGFLLYGHYSVVYGDLEGLKTQRVHELVLKNADFLYPDASHWFPGNLVVRNNL